MRSLSFIISTVLVMTVKSLAQAESEKPPSSKLRLTVSTDLKKETLFIENKVDQSICGNKQPRERLQISPDGHLQSIVAFLEPKNSTIQVQQTYTTPTITLKKCTPEPRIVLTAPGKPVMVKSSDPILYQFRSQTKSNGRRVFTLPPNLETLAIRYDVPEVIKVVDDIHPWIKFFIVVEDRMITATTDSLGIINIVDIPQGTYRLTLWHELLGSKVINENLDLKQSKNLQIQWNLHETN